MTEIVFLKPIARPLFINDGVLQLSFCFLEHDWVWIPLSLEKHHGRI